MFINLTKKARRGFTLIELLVVIAIIGILASVVLASLNTARTKSRDARRIADLNQLKLSLELYFDNAREYPTTAQGTAVLSPTYISQVPSDPLTAVGPYDYAGTPAGCDNAATVCTGYHIGAILEETANNALTTDSDTTVGFDGTSVACTTTAGTPQPGGTELCYDLIP